jgi:hypothetical protein
MISAAGVPDSETAPGARRRRPADDEGPKPVPFPVPLDIRSISLTGLFLLAVLYTLYFARAFIVPVVVAVLISLLLQRVVRCLTRLGIPGARGRPRPPRLSRNRRLRRLPALRPRHAMDDRGAGPFPVKAKLDGVLRPVQKMSRPRKMAAAADLDGNRTLQVEVKGDSIARCCSGTQQFLGMTVVVVFLLFLLLASGDLFLGKVIKVLPASRTREGRADRSRDRLTCPRTWPPPRSSTRASGW